MLRSSRRLQGYSGNRRDRDEEYAKDYGEQEQNAEPARAADGKEDRGQADEPGGQQTRRQAQGSDTDRFIVDMAKGFVEAQAKLAPSPAAPAASPEMLSLLQKISQQLEELNKSQGQSPKPSSQDQPEQGQAQSRQQDGAQGRQGGAAAPGGNDSSPQDLQTLFSRLLQGENQNKAASSPGGAQGGQQGGEAQKSGKSKTVTAQTAAQVLAQAQYELANELEASLKKLKQVISESEKLADKISSLLGEEANSK